MSRKVQLEEQRAELLAKNEAVDRELQEVSAQLEPMKVRRAHCRGGGGYLSRCIYVCFACLFVLVHICFKFDPLPSFLLYLLM